MVHEGAKVTSRVRRAIQEKHYGLDASKLTTKTASPEAIAFSAVEESLWVGVLRWTKEARFSATLEVRFTSAEGEHWTWQALDDPWIEDPRAPE